MQMDTRGAPRQLEDKSSACGKGGGALVKMKITHELMQECVKRRAKLSLLAATDACKDLGTVEATIASVWDSCYNDTEPFIDIP